MLKKEAIEETNKALAKQAKTLAEDVEYMDKYVKGLIDGKSTTDHFNDTLGKASKSAQDQAEALQNGTMSAEVYEQQQKATSASTQALGATSKVAEWKVKALSIAMNVGLMLAVTGVIKIIERLITAQQRAVDAAKETAQAYQQDVDSIDAYKQKITELKKSLDTGNLSQSEAYDKRKELMAIQDEIIAKYGDEAGAIDLVSGSLKDQIDTLDAVMVAKANVALIKDQSGIETATDKMTQDNLYNLGISIVPYENNDEILGFIKQFEDAGITFDENGDGTINIRFVGDSREAETVISNFAAKLREFGKGKENNNSINEILGFTEGAFKQASKITEKYGDLYDTANEYKIITDVDYSNLYTNAINAKKDFDEAIAKNDETGIKSSLEAIKKAEEDVAKTSIEDIGVADYFQTYFDEIAQQTAKQKFKVDLEVNTEGLKDSVKGTLDQLSGLDDIGILNIGKIEGTAEQETGFQKLIDVAKNYGLTIEDLIPLLVDFGMVQGETANQNFVLSQTTSDVIKSFSDMESKLSDISAVLNEFSDKGIVTASSLSKLSETFGTLSGFEDFINILSNSSSTMADVESSLTSLIGEYLSASDVLSNVNNKTLGLVTAQLKAIGVTNAEEVATAALSQAQARLAADKLIAAEPTLLNLTYAETNAILSEAGASDAAAQMVYFLAIQKALASDATLSSATATETQRLIEMAQACGAAAGMVGQLTAKLHAKQLVEQGVWNPGIDRILNSEIVAPDIPTIDIGAKFNFDGYTKGASSAASAQKDQNKALEEYLALLEHRKTMGVYTSETNQLAADLKYTTDLEYALNNLTKTEEERRSLSEKIYTSQKKALEDEKARYESVASAVVSRYDEEIDSINESIKAVDRKLKRHEKEKSELEAAHNAVIRMLDKEIEALQTKYDKELELLEKNKSEREKAHNAVTSLIDDEIKKYQKEQEAIDELYNPQIEAIQKQIDLLKEKNDESQREIDLEKAKAALENAKNQKTVQTYVEGQGFVYTADQDAIREAQENLDKLLQEKETSDLEKQLAELEKEREEKKEAFDDQIKDLEKYKEQWDEILSSFEKAQNIDIMNSLFGEGWSADVLAQNTDILNQFKDEYLNIQQQLADTLAEQEAANARAEILEGYKQQWQDELDSYRNAQEQELADKIFYAGWEQDILNGRHEAFDIFKEQYLEIQDRIVDDTLQKEKYEREIERIEGYKAEWQSMLDEYNRTANEKHAMEVLGAEWEEDIFTDREAVLEKFKTSYDNIQSQIIDINKITITSNTSLATSTNKLANSLERQANAIRDVADAQAYAKEQKSSRGSGASRGFASGTSHAPQGLANTDELGEEYKLVQPTRGKYTLMQDGDMVLNHQQTKGLFDFATNPTQMIQGALSRMVDFNAVPNYLNPNNSMSRFVPVTNNNAETTNFTLTGNLSFPNITQGGDAEKFVRELKNLKLDAIQRYRGNRK